MITLVRINGPVDPKTVKPGAYIYRPAPPQPKSTAEASAQVFMQLMPRE